MPTQPAPLLPSMPATHHHIRPSLFLDYGADAVDGEDAACEICERGMRFKAPWQFQIGAVLHIAFALDDSPCRIEVEGLVVECLETGVREKQTTLAFVDVPQELRASLGKVSTRLEFRRCASGAHPVTQ